MAKDVTWEGEGAKKQNRATSRASPSMDGNPLRRLHHPSLHPQHNVFFEARWFECGKGRWVEVLGGPSGWLRLFSLLFLWKAHCVCITARRTLD